MQEEWHGGILRNRKKKEKNIIIITRKRSRSAPGGEVYMYNAAERKTLKKGVRKRVPMYINYIGHKLTTDAYKYLKMFYWTRLNASMNCRAS